MENKEKKRGRPVVADSKRQIKLKARQDKIDSGILIKPGRPKTNKKEEETKVADITNTILV